MSNEPDDIGAAILQFDRAAVADKVATAQLQAEQIRAAFPLAEWPQLTLERYALGTPDSKSSFCYALEFGSRELGSISGGSARKLIMYARKDGTGYYFDSAYADPEEAWQALRSGFLKAFDLARQGRMEEVDEVDALRSGPVITAKALFVYFPDQLLPIFSQEHLRHFVERLTGEAARGLPPLTANRRLLNWVQERPELAGWHPIEVMYLLYEWGDPRSAPAVVKIAPGEGARLWPECRDGGFICVGWDEVGDLAEFASEEELRAAFAAHNPYNGNQGTVNAKARELWKLRQLQPGDLVVANEGQSKVLAVGTVVTPGYAWRPERAGYKHTVAVSWDESYARTLPEPVKRWGVVTVADVPGPLWRKITGPLEGGPQATVGQAQRGDSALPPTTLDPQLQAIADALQRKGQVVLFGPPGTGKTYTALRFALSWLADNRSDVDPLVEYGSSAFRQTVASLSAADASQQIGQLTQVTFHPSYGYEDFIEGFKPVAAPDGGLNLRLVDGIFKRVCRAASADPKRRYLVLIDEINRGNIPKILGELITLLEVDKRGLAVRLPQSGESFAVPPNVHLLGTMNTADRSIRLLDAALRRRFVFLELAPDAEVLEGAYVGKLHLAELLTGLNSRIRTELGRERQVGHAFLLRDSQPIASEEDFAAVIRGEVVPLLQEYAYDDYAMLARLLGQQAVDETRQRLRELTDVDLVDALYTEFQTAPIDTSLP